jgi:HTH-type transcriptional regulator/antitoxin HigA
MKAWSVIQNKTEYHAVIKRIEELSANPPDVKSDEGRELMLLGFLADKYEDETFPVTYPDPIDAIKVRMDDLNLSVHDLLDVFGDRGTASKILNRKRSLSIGMIRRLSEKLALPLTLLIRPIHKSTKKKKSLSTANEPTTVYKKKPRKKR